MTARFGKIRTGWSWVEVEGRSTRMTDEKNKADEEGSEGKEGLR